MRESKWFHFHCEKNQLLQQNCETLRSSHRWMKSMFLIGIALLLSKKGIEGINTADKNSFNCFSCKDFIKLSWACAASIRLSAMGKEQQIYI